MTMKIDNILLRENLPDELVIEAHRAIDVRCGHCRGEWKHIADHCPMCHGRKTVRRFAKLRLFVSVRYSLLRSRFVLAEDGFSGPAEFTEARAIDGLISMVLLAWSAGVRFISAEIKVVEVEPESK